MITLFAALLTKLAVVVAVAVLHVVTLLMKIAALQTIPVLRYVNPVVLMIIVEDVPLAPQGRNVAFSLMV